MISRLLTETATIVRRSAATPDAEGNPTVTESSVEVKCRLAQQSTDDQSTSGDRRSTTLRLYLEPTVEVDGNDRVVYGDRTFEIEGSPYRAATPRAAHHWEVTLREVTP